MIERWRTTTSFVYITVLWSCICCDNVCFAKGFKSLIASYFNVHQYRFCPVEASIGFGNSHKRSLSEKGTSPNSSLHGANSGNCTNNLTAAESLRNPPSTPATHSAEGDTSVENSTEDAHQPIVTFDEWTKEKLKQEHRKVLPPPPTAETGLPNVGAQHLPPGAGATRNYASKECGAKVLLSNPEAENTKAILNEKEKDEYMRNPCTKAENKFVIVELCETVQPRIIELANYELFSSGPRTIRLWSAERFPSGEWQLLTELTAIDSRQIQQFPIPTTGAYVKFIKVELLSHYGNEHYCTLSVLKILGISMVDEYEAEAEAASAVHTRTSVGNVDVELNATSAESINPTATTDSPPESSPTLHSTQFKVLQQQESENTMEENRSSVAEQDASNAKPIVMEIVDEVSGRLIEKIVSVVKDNFGTMKNRPGRSMREESVPSAFMACYFCPKDGMYLYPRQFCQAFVWKRSAPPIPKRVEMSWSESALAQRLGIFSVNRSRRERFTFLQRKTFRRVQPSVSSIVQSQAQQRKLTMETMKQLESQSIKVAPDNQQNAPLSQKQIHADVWPASSISHKESVFMKLNKRIAALELNMSLSSEYLSELSRQYVAQTDEHQKQLKQAKKVVDDAVMNIYARVNETLSQKIALLRKEVDTLSLWLSSMRLTASKMTVRRFIGGERRTFEKCYPRQTDLHHYSPPDDGLWTTEQVVYMVIFTQLLTVVIFALLSHCYQRFVHHQQLSDDQRMQVEEMISERVSETLAKSCALLQLFEKQRPNRTKPKSPHVEMVGSSRSDESLNLVADCSSSSRATASDESGAEEVPIPRSFPEMRAIKPVTSVA